MHIAQKFAAGFLIVSAIGFGLFFANGDPSIFPRYVLLQIFVSLHAGLIAMFIGDER